MKNPKKILISTNKKIQDALDKLELTQEKLLICINESKKFVGVINDGDIRRAIIKGANLNEKIKKYVNLNASIVTEQISEKEASKLITSRVMVLPVIDSFQNVIGYFSFNGREKNFSLISKEITVLGMGYVGLTLSAVLSQVGFRVNGYDTNKKVIRNLKKKITPFYEKGLKKYIIQNNKKKLFFVDSLKNIKSSIFVISVGTPIDKKKTPNLKNLKKAAETVGKSLVEGNLIILRSTLPVGITRKLIIPILEKFSKMKAGRDFSVSFAPERTAEGNALNELRENPQIIGGFDEKSSEITANFFNTFTHSIVHVPSLEAAEFCKLIDNTYRDHRFAFVNQFVKFSEKMNLDLTKIVAAVNHGYSRNDIPTPSPGVGGPCLTKDPHILSYNLSQNNISPALIKLSRSINERVVTHVHEKILTGLKKINKEKNKVKIFIIGMSFKGNPETSDIRNSSSLDLIKKLKYKNIFIYDALVKYNLEVYKKLNLKISSLKDGFNKADVVIIMNNHKDFYDLDIYNYINSMNKPSIFIDTWHIFDPLEIKQLKGIIYYGVGND